MNLRIVLACLIVALLSLVTASEAHAQASNCTGNAGMLCTIQEAADDCQSRIAAANANSYWDNGRCVHKPNNASEGRFELWVDHIYGFANHVSSHVYQSGCPAGGWDEAIGSCIECQGGQDRGLAFPGDLGVYQCQQGTCPVSAQLQPDGFVRWISIPGPMCGADEACPSGTTPSALLPGRCIPDEHCPAGTQKNLETGECVPPAVCPDGQAKDQFGLCKPQDNQCPPGQIKSPEGNCLPGEGQCSVGQARGSDGTCKKDSDGDGKPDDDDGDGVPDGEDVPEPKFSGGDNCEVPPQCSGDNIMCGQARIQWRIDCNTRKNAQITGGQCGAPPVCAGDGCKAMDYAILLTTWRTACALENAKDGDPSNDGGTAAWDAGAFAEGVVDAAASTGQTCTGDDCPGGVGGGGGEGEGDGELDDAGLGWSRSCPVLPSVSVMGATIDFNAVAGGDLCDWISLGGQIVLILAALASLRILSGGMG